MFVHKAFTAALIAVTLVGTAHAGHSGVTLRGGLFGAVFQNGIDLDADGLNGRSGLLRARDGVFAYVDTNVDSTTSFEQGSCLPGEVEIWASGQVAFSTLNGRHVIFAEIDSSVPVCFGLGRPEVVSLVITGGRGAFAGATGEGAVTLPDDVVLNVDPGSGFPRVVYVHDGEYELKVD